MEILSSVWHVVTAFLLLLLGARVAFSIAMRFDIGQARASCLYAWHTIFSIVYLWYVMSFGGDAIVYYKSAESFSWELNYGTQAVNFLTGLIVDSLSLSILDAFLIFNIFGFVGLLAFDASLRKATHDKPKQFRRLATAVVFLPSVSFWSSAIGKDALSFMAAGLALWAALALTKRWLLMAFAILIMLLVRPHVAAMMVAAWSFECIANRRTPLRLRVFLMVLFIPAMPILLSFVFQYVGLGDAYDITAVSGYIDLRQSYNREGGGAIDIASMSAPMQLFTYMFRPGIFEATTIFALVAAVDNLVLLYLSISGAWAMLCGGKSNLGESRAFMWVYSWLAWLSMAMTTSNIGIALRQKWMFAPILIFLMFSVIGTQKPRTFQNRVASAPSVASDSIPRISFVSCYPQ
jgi:hypothetical protein